MVRPVFFRVGVFAVLVLAASTARSEPSPRSYVKPLALCDAGAVLPTAVVGVYLGVTATVDLLWMAYVSGSRETTPIPNRSAVDLLPKTLLVTGAGYVACGPIVHAVHGRPAASVASFGARVGLPLAGAIVTYGIAQATLARDGRDHMFDGWQAGAAGVVLIPGGFAAALAIDYAILARPDSVAPFVRPERDGAVVGLGGTF